MGELLDKLKGKLHHTDNKAHELKGEMQQKVKDNRDEDDNYIVL